MVRLAQAQGLLNRPSLNIVQMWALQYWIYMERRIAIEDTQAELELQCNFLNYDRWQQIQQASSGSGGDWGQAFGGDEERPITDPQDLDTWFNNLERTRGMTGAEIDRRIPDSGLLGATNGGGRRV